MLDEKFIMDGFERVLDAMDNMERRFNERIDGLEQHFNERMDRLEQRIDALEQRMDALEQRMDGLEQRMDRVEVDMAGLKQGQQMIVERLDKIEDKFEIILEMYGEHEVELRDSRKRLRRLEDNYTSILKEEDTYDND